VTQDLLAAEIDHLGFEVARVRHHAAVVLEGVGEEALVGVEALDAVEEAGRQAERTEAHRVDVRADISWLTLSGSFGRGEDNLDEIPSVLTTQTDRTGYTATLPLQRAGRWLPSLNYRLDRTHQLGLDLPTNGGFSESHIPDQVSLNHSASARWQIGRVRLGDGKKVAAADAGLAAGERLD